MIGKVGPKLVAQLSFEKENTQESSLPWPEAPGVCPRSDETLDCEFAGVRPPSLHQFTKCLCEPNGLRSSIRSVPGGSKVASPHQSFELVLAVEDRPVPVLFICLPAIKINMGL